MKSPFRFAGLFALVGLAAWACAGGDISSPSGSVRSAPMSQAASEGTGGGPLLKCRRDGAFQSSADIGPSGGRLFVGHNRLIVPAGALTRTVHIVATVPRDTLAFVAFEPSGLVFSKPVRLVIDVRRCNLNAPSPGEGLQVVYLDDDFNILERIDARHDPFRQTVSASIHHFSGYGVAW